jgi:hypothetical protein
LGHSAHKQCDTQIEMNNIKLKIDIHYDRENPYQIDVYLRHQEIFKKKGILCRFYANCFPSLQSNADIFVAQADFLGPNPERLRRPIVIEEREDSAMPIARDIAAIPYVVRFFKVAVVGEHLINLRADRAHLWVLDREASEARCQKQRTLTESESAKIKPGIHFGLFKHMQPWVDRAARRTGKDQWNNRPIDALFIGTTEYGLPTLSAHRQRFNQAMVEIRGLNIVCIPSRLMHKDSYFTLSQNAKIIVSPWGHGELCFRDFESWLDDCVLVKPRTDFIRTLDNILTTGETYEPCRADARDLERTLRSILANPIYQAPELRRRNREKLLSWWSPEKLVDWWCADIKSAVRL